MPYPFSYYSSPPTFSVWRSHPHLQSRVLITAGVDGDEYAGIEAAHQLINIYQGQVPLTIIPIVNLAGYSAKTSYNPLDRRYPKHIFPGSSWGSSSSRLMHQIAYYTDGIELWIDLHGGATNEHLPHPFIWSSQIFPVLTYLTGTTLIETSVEKNLPYLLFEAGELGIIETNAVNQHLAWIKQALTHLYFPALTHFSPTYTHVNYHDTRPPTLPNTLWYSPTQHITAS